MDTLAFLEYLHDDAATSKLAVSLGEVLGLRGRDDLAPVAMESTRRVPVAS